MICVFPSFEHSAGCVRNLQTILGFSCVPCGHQTTGGINATLMSNKTNRAKPMFELPSAIFSIADGNEFRFARFYIVCEAVPLGTLGNSLIVCGLSDTSCGVSKRGKRHRI